MKVKPVLQGFAARVQALLVEWPRHPNLVQVKNLCDNLILNEFFFGWVIFTLRLQAESFLFTQLYKSFTFKFLTVLADGGH